MADAQTLPYDKIPPDAFALETTPFDYIVIGSGAGGGPLAARLALGGMRVLVLEAGADSGAPTPTLEDENEHAIYHCPGLHTASTEPEEHGAKPPIEGSYYYHVQHFNDGEQNGSDRTVQPERPADLTARRRWYPRSRSIGGCTAHHAMIAVAPPDADWQHIADITGDASWRPELMRALFSRLERFTRGKHLTLLGLYWNRLLDFWNPDRHLAGRRGNRGWLDISFTDPQLALGDSRLTEIIKRAAVTGHSSVFAALWRWVKRIIRGRFYEDLDLNDARTISSIEEGMALLPLAVSTGINTPWSPRPGMRRGPRELLFETRELLKNRLPKSDRSERSLTGELCIVTLASVERIVFHRNDSNAGLPQAVGVMLDSNSRAADEDNRCCYARREVVVCGGAFESPKLLMLSGIGNQSHLAECGLRGPSDESEEEVAPIVDLPGVGRNLGDRYEISVISRMSENWKSLTGAHFTLDSSDAQLIRWKRDREGIYATNGGVVALLFKSKLRKNEEQSAGDRDRETGLRTKLAPDVFFMGFPAAFRGYYPGWSHDLLSDERNAPASERVALRNLWSWTILKAWSRNAGEVRLNPDDPQGPPEINFHYFEQRDLEGKWRFNPEDPDLLALQEAVAVARRVNREANSLMLEGSADTAEIQPGNTCPDGSAALQDWIVEEAWGHHACGTCRVGKDAWRAKPFELSDREAVVDSKFRVHGVTNLRVVDASIFPKIPGYFLAVPTFMIAEKAADTLLAEPASLPRELRALEANAIRHRRKLAKFSIDNDKGNSQSPPPTPPPPAPQRPGGPPPPPPSNPVLASDQYALPPQTVGLALSGGGIRSATFGLGLIQSLAKKNLLRRIDYISTASGGGYTGAFLGGLFRRVSRERDDPAGDVQDQLRDHRSRPIRWLRNNASYLVSDGTSDWWQLFTVYLRNLMTLYFVILTVGFAVFGSFQFLSTYFPAATVLERFGVATPEVGGIVSQTLYSISPWWLAIVFIFTLITLPSSIAYWLSPHIGSRGYVSFFALLFWIALCCGLIVAMQLPGGFGLGLGTVVVAAVGIGLFVLFRIWPQDDVRGHVILFTLLFSIVLCCGLIVAMQLLGGFGLGLGTVGVAAVGIGLFVLFHWLPPQVDPTFLGRLMRNRASRLMSISLMWLAVAVVWTVIDTLSRVIAAGHLTSLLAGWALVIAPWLPFVRGLSLPVKNLTGTDSKEIEQQSIADRFPRVALLLSIALLGFLLIVVDTAVHMVWMHDPTWGFSATVIAIVLSAAVAKAVEFLNGSTLLNIYSARLSRTFVGASSDSRTMAPSFSALANIQRYHPSDDIPFDLYRPQDAGGPLHLIGVCVNETVDAASQREIADRRSIPMCVGPYGVSVGRFHAVWEDSNGTIAPTLIRFRKWLNGVDAAQARVLRAILNHDDPFHVLADKSGGPAFVELLTLGQWIAVSGAAFGTGLGRHTTKGASILAGLANARLGYWWDSGLFAADRPGVAVGTLIYNAVRSPFRFFIMQYMLYSEWMGRFAGPTQRYWNLSDGGHFDNTAVYELIRRRVPLIFAVDGSADPEIRFDDIADLMRHARTDFGAEIEFLTVAPAVALPPDLPPWVINWLQLKAIGCLQKLTASECHAALARITWSDSSQVAWLVYIKASVCGDEPADVTNYKRGKPVFPSEPTTDQFFTERQWESYRRLGQHIAEKLF